MKKASNSAWDSQWPAAIREYKRALAELPEDAPAHQGLARAFEESSKLEEALHEYRLCAKLQPLDPAPLMHTASLYRKLGKTAEATEAYLQLAEMFSGQKQMSRAVEAWRQAAALDPERIEIREKLISAFKEAGHQSAAAQELTALAKIYQRRNDAEGALKAAEEALQLDPDNTQAKALVAELRGRQARASGTEEGSPVEQARRSSLSRLAQTVFEDGPRWRRTPTGAPRASGAVEVETLVAKAIDAQTHNRANEAMETYEQILKAGMVKSEIQFNLALLYQTALRYDEAIALLKQTANDSQFALASYMAIGQCYRAQGKGDDALGSFIQAMKIVDLSTVERDQADDIIKLYESLAEGYRAKGAQSHAESFMQTLVEFLGNKGWEDKAREVRRHVETVAESGTPISLAEVLETPDADSVIECMRLSAEYVKAGYLHAANDEALRAIAIAPSYLPAHVLLAEVLEHSGRQQEALDKFEMLAEVAAVRGDLPKAIAFCHHALELAPEDVTRRSKLIDLLVRQSQISEALDEYLRLGAALERAGQSQKAIDRYAEGLRLAQRTGAVSPAVATLRTRLSEGLLKARDWKNALPLYEEMRTASPEDERTRFILIDLYLRLGMRDKGERELDELLRRSGPTSNKARAMLSALARTNPYDVSVNVRLARAYAAAGQRSQAIEALDKLGDHLLSTDQREAATIVIQEIISLEPPQIEEYRKLLSELTAT
ncbi:MAG: tetratricopeptide repeat protein [Anaerolineae bacterium]